MIEYVKFTNINGSVIQLNDDTNIYPLLQQDTAVDVRMTEREKAQQHGLYPSNTYLGKRTFSFEGDILEQTSERYWMRRRAMIAAFMPRPQLGYKVGDLEMRLTGWEEVVTSECTLDGWPSLPLGASSPSRGSYAINLKAFDPRLYGYEQSVDLVFGINDNVGGRTYDKTYNKTYIGGTVPDSDIVNAGDIETFPIIVINGPVTDPVVVLATSDGTINYFSLDGLTLAGVGDTVTVDFLRRTATGDSGQNYYNFAHGADWWAIEPLPLTNSVSFVGASAGVGAKATVKWRNAYMI